MSDSSVISMKYRMSVEFETLQTTRDIRTSSWQPGTRNSTLKPFNIQLLTMFNCDWCNHLPDFISGAAYQLVVVSCVFSRKNAVTKTSNLKELRFCSWDIYLLHVFKTQVLKVSSFDRFCVDSWVSKRWQNGKSCEFVCIFGQMSNRDICDGNFLKSKSWDAVKSTYNQLFALLSEQTN